jgi:hypothetical protein
LYLIDEGLLLLVSSLLLLLLLLTMPRYSSPSPQYLIIM